MSNQDLSNTGTLHDWRLKLGLAIFLLSIILPVAGIPALSSFDLSTAVISTISGALLIAAELLGIAAVAVMGKPGYLYIKSRFFDFLKRHGPPQVVSRRRYTIGIIMFSIPLVFGLISIYLADYIPGYSQHPLYYAVSFDMLLLASLFVLGGDFWDKLRSLFIYDATADFSKK
jgi:hypothetical protein